MADLFNAGINMPKKAYNKYSVFSFPTVTLQ